MNSIAMTKRSRRPGDFTLAVHVNSGDTYEWSKVLLARAHFNGTLEVLTAAWELVLGYGRHEFEGKTLSQFMGSNKTDGRRRRSDTRRTQHGPCGFDAAQQGRAKPNA